MEKFVDPDLGHVSYIVACDATKEAFVIDPRRDIGEYIDFINAQSLKLKYIFNTHTHADYVGGHLELAECYGAENVFQKDVPAEAFVIRRATHHDQILIGDTLVVEVIETPGHTPFDICLLVSENGTEKILFTGDFLFVGEIGRPDLLGEENVEQLANNSYESAQKLWILSDDIIIFPSHIQGSLCGKNLGRQYFSTIGIEKKNNTSFFLSQAGRDKYVANLFSQNIETPAFFKRMAGINIKGPVLVSKIWEKIREIGYHEIRKGEEIQIVDIREPHLFHKNHIKGSINLGDRSNISLIAGNLLDYDQPVIIVGTAQSDFEGVVKKLLRVGIDNIEGIFNGDFGMIENTDLTASKIVRMDEITNEYTNILLDDSCSERGVTVQSNISSIKTLDLSKYEKIVFSCNAGYKSSALTSYFSKNDDRYFFIA